MNTSGPYGLEKKSKKEPADVLYRVVVGLRLDGGDKQEGTYA